MSRALVSPVSRDDDLQQGWPVVAMRQAHEHTVKAEPVSVTHSYAALAFYVGGEARVEQGRDWNLGAGDLLVVPAGQPHRMLEARRPELWGLGFCVPCFAADGEAALLDPFERVRDGAAAVVHVPAERQAFLESLFREMEALGRGAPGGAAARSAVQRSLLTLILNEVDKASEHAPRGATSSSVVTESLRFIERNALRRLTLGEIAEAVGRSPAYVTSALSRATGRSALEWVVSARMAEARRRLLHSDEMVDVIAERVGYADPTHFIRMFRRAHGTTPAAWRAARAQR